MPSRKSGKRRSSKRKKGPEPTRFKGLFLHVIIFLFLTFPLAIVLLVPTPPVERGSHPVYEEFTKAPKTPPVKKRKKKAKSAEKKLPLVAIIIDDMGYDYNLDKEFILLDAPLSFAFLPYGPNTKRLVHIAHKKKRDILVHLPMEPENKALDPGPGVLMVDMGFDELIDTLKRNISCVPGAIGVNNHMGSRFTADARAMEYVLAYLKERGLFFVDSRTTKETIAFETAKKMGVPCAERAVFLDHDNNKQKIGHELERLVRVAKKNGAAIAIGHPYKNTYEVLFQRLPIIRKEVRLVPVHMLVH